jgi:hypothetical protein
MPANAKKPVYAAYVEHVPPDVINDDGVWVDRLGDRMWIEWARATVQQDLV